MDMPSGEELFLLQDGLGLMSCKGDFFVLDQLGLCFLCSLLLGLGLGFGDATKTGKSKTSAKNSVDLAFLWGNKIKKYARRW